MMENSTNEYIRGAVESLLFISDKPVTLEQIKAATQSVGVAEIRTAIGELKSEYEQNKRGMVILEIAGGFQMLSSPNYAEYVRNFFKVRVKEKLSKPALETLAIVAYKQPVSRGDVELIRGVNSDGVVTNLLDKGLIKIVGRKDVPGRPYLYGTTKLFLEYFGLKSLDGLPKIEDFVNLPQGADEPARESEEQSGQEARQAADEDGIAGSAEASRQGGDVDESRMQSAEAEKNSN